MHWGKALMWSTLWGPACQMSRSNVSTMEQILKDPLKDGEPPESQEAMVQRYLEQL
ncbi:hypothetical protein [Gynuella sp.]|uniref:hypothetical protein n=1 Tax=Gynuella sp. TaxID=2969146 RepID=UPI003D0D8CFA